LQDPSKDYKGKGKYGKGDKGKAKSNPKGGSGKGKGDGWNQQQHQPQQYDHAQIGGINVEGLSAVEAKRRTTQSVADKTYQQYIAGLVSKKKLDATVYAAAAATAAVRTKSAAPSTRASRRAQAETVEAAAAKAKGKGGKPQTKKGDGKGKSGKGNGKERSASEQPKGNLPCIFEVKGKCTKGDLCIYSHENALIKQQRVREGRDAHTGVQLTEAEIAKKKADYQKNKKEKGKGKGKPKGKGKRVAGAVMEEFQADGSITYYDDEGNATGYNWSKADEWPTAEPFASAPILNSAVTDTVQSTKPTTIPAMSATSVLGFLLEPTDTAYVEPKKPAY